MRLFNWLFKRKKKTVVCPRCLGKGKVDYADIKRLQMELKWMPGRCAYCNGVGRVSPEMVANVEVNEAYLTTDLSARERLLLINKDPETILRAASHEQQIDDVIEHIRHQYFNQNRTVEEIARYYLDSGWGMEPELYNRQKKELVEYINRVINTNNPTGMFNFFKSTRKQPVFSALSAYPHKSHYFRRVASWTDNGSNIIVVDPHRPRIITMDPWPQAIFIAADGQMTIEQYVGHVARQYSGKVPEGLDTTIINELETLLKERLVELCEVQQRPEPAFDQPGK